MFFLSPSRSHKAVKGTPLKKRRMPSWAQFIRPRLALVLLLASALQSYITQTHIHAQTFSSLGGYTAEQTNTQTTALNSGALEIAGQLAPAQKQNPLEEPATCPIYNEMLCAGHYLPAQASTAPFIRDISENVIFAYADPVARKTAGAYHWQGRAPPLV